MNIRTIFLSFFFFLSNNIWAQTSNTFFDNNYTLETTLPMNETDLLVSYLKISSNSGNEKLAGEFLRNVCLQSGLSIAQYGSENGNFNFAASLYPLSQQKPNLIFINHIDVVPNGEVIRWMHPPLEGRIINDEIWGRGAFDNKGMAVIQLSAIARFVMLSKTTELPLKLNGLIYP